MATQNLVAVPDSAPAALREGLLSGPSGEAIRHVGPVLVGIAPFGVAIGVAIAESPVNNFAGWAGGPLLYAGSSHLAAISMLGAGASWMAVVMTVAIVNARFAIYSAGLARQWQDQPAWFRWAASVFVIDHLFALCVARAEEGRSGAWIRRYYFTAVALMSATWLPVIALGIALGPVLPAERTLGFAAPVLMMALVAPVVHARPGVAAAAVGAAVALAATPWIGSAALLAGAGAGAVAGRSVERRAS